MNWSFFRKKKRKREYSYTSTVHGEWVFNKDTEEENVPQIILNFRKEKNGLTAKELDEIYWDIRIKNPNPDFMTCLHIINYVEPLVELYKTDELAVNISYLIIALQTLLEGYVVSGAKGQIENIEEIINYFPELEYNERMKDVWTEFNAVGLQPKSDKVF